MSNLLELTRRAKGMAAIVGQDFYDNDPLLRTIPIIEIGKGTTSGGWNEVTGLPTPQNRAANSDYTRNQATTKHLQKQLKLYGGKVGIDYALKARMGVQATAIELESQIFAIRSAIVNDFFNGSSTTNPLQMDGLKSFLPTTTAGRIDRGYVTNNGGAALSRIKLDETIDEVRARPFDGTRGKIIFCDYRVPKMLGRYADTLAQFGKDVFGMPVLAYDGIPLIPIYQNQSDSDILGFGESGSTSSLFVVNLDLNAVSLMSGDEGILTREEKDGSKDVEQVDWWITAKIQGKRNAARLYNFTNATAVA